MPESRPSRQIIEADCKSKRAMPGTSTKGVVESWSSQERPYQELEFELHVATATSRIDGQLAFPFIAPRRFNAIAIHGPFVIKTSSCLDTLGELYFYEHVPRDIAHLFPRLIGSKVCHQGPERSITFAMERVVGPTLSSLFVHGQLTRALFHRFLHSLCSIHSSAGNPLEARQGKHIYANYARKVEARYTANKSLYAALGLGLETTATAGRHLIAELQQYERQQRGAAVNVIHGDPVFTNVVVATSTDSPVFLDMRGALGDRCVLYGDATYDLAKVLQSLCGYDQVVHEVGIAAAQLADMRGLVEVFEEFVRGMYPHVRFDDVVLITSSLLFSAIPLHDDRGRQAIFGHVSLALLTVVMRRGGEEAGGAQVMEAVGRCVNGCHTAGLEV